jgi:hypothetical protein
MGQFLVEKLVAPGSVLSGNQQTETDRYKRRSHEPLALPLSQALRDACEACRQTALAYTGALSFGGDHADGF